MYFHHPLHLPADGDESPVEHVDKFRRLLERAIQGLKAHLSEITNHGQLDLQALKDKSDNIVKLLTTNSSQVPSEREKLTPEAYQTIYHINIWVERYHDFWTTEVKKTIRAVFKSEFKTLMAIAENYQLIKCHLMNVLTAHYASEHPDLLFEDILLKTREKYHFRSPHSDLYSQIKYYFNLLFAWVIQKVAPKGHIALMNSYEVKGVEHVSRVEMNPWYSAQELQLYHLFTSDLYKLNILKLIPEAHHNALHELLNSEGDETVLESRLHMQYRDHCHTTLNDGKSPKMRLTGMGCMMVNEYPTAILSFFNLHWQVKAQEASEIHARLRSSSTEELSPGRTCATHVANIIITNLYALNKSLNKQLDTEGITYLNIPFLYRPLETIFPHEIFSELEAKGAISSIPAPGKVSKVLKLRT